MKHAFSPHACSDIRNLRDRRLLMAFDFDGTLAPIVPYPHKARIPRAVVARLIAIADNFPIAILSGRSVADVKPRLGIEPRFLVGNHGMEGIPVFDAFGTMVRTQCREWAEVLNRWVQGGAAPSGVFVEDKEYSISVHYRLARDREQVCAEITAMVETLHPPPRIMSGHCVINLVAQEAPDKGAALTQLLLASGCETAIYVGDDETDESVFRAGQGSWLTVRVGYHPGSAAQYCLNHQSEVAVFLSRMEELLLVSPDFLTSPGNGNRR